MALTTFGGILGFALEIEMQNAKLLTDAEAMANEAADKSLFGKLADNSRKRLKEIERTRRESVSEMILENITGFSKTQFMRNPVAVKSLCRDDLIHTVSDLLTRSACYFETAAQKLERLSDVARVMKRLAKKADQDSAIVQLTFPHFESNPAG